VFPTNELSSKISSNYSFSSLLHPVLGAYLYSMFISFCFILIPVFITISEIQSLFVAISAYVGLTIISVPFLLSAVSLDQIISYPSFSSFLPCSVHFVSLKPKIPVFPSLMMSVPHVFLFY
jgi:hypothetical protein